MEKGPLVMDAQTFLDSAGAGSGDFATETIYFHFTSALLQSYQAAYDGWISGWKHSYTTGLGIAINLVPPAAAVALHQIYVGFVLPPQNESTSAPSGFSAEGQQRWHFKVGDVINVRPLVAGSGFVALFLCHPT